MSVNYVIAVSGGVDSVALLDMIAGGLVRADRLIVAHFDHGIRPDSASDASFVKTLAEKYDLPFEMKREELGEDASEELARDRRYAFLRSTAEKYDATIVTAHHADDVVETIAINLLRGTGWRGLAVLNGHDVVRPLLDRTKAELIAYAKECQLEWREDSTNTDLKYLRNDLRQKLTALGEPAKETLRAYRDRQVNLRKMIAGETDAIIQTPYSRYFFTSVSSSAGIELLRAVLLGKTGQAPIRPHLERALLAIKTYQSGKVFAIDATYVLRFSRSDFVVATRDEVVS